MTDLHKRVSRRIENFLSNGKSADRIAAEVLQMAGEHHAASVDGRRMAETENTGSVPQGTTSAVPSEASADAHPSAPSLQTPQGGDS